MKKLFSPYMIGNVTLKNRVVMSPMGMESCYDEDGKVTEFHKIHYASRAIGQVGLIMVEATAITLEGRDDPKDLGIWSDDHIAGLKELVNAVHEQGAKIGIQFCHAGRKSRLALSPLAPSAIPYDENSVLPQEMSIEQIKETIAEFGEAARRAKAAGFDIIELHGAHGYLINEFLSPLSNERRDEYGGDRNKRYTFLSEVIKAVKAVWEGPLFVRISATDYHPEGNTIEDYIYYSQLMKEQGVDLVDCSSGWIVPPVNLTPFPGYQISFAEKIKREVGIATSAVGFITTGIQAEEILMNDRADLVFIGSELLRDPFWVRRAAKELRAEIEAPIPYERIWAR